MYEGKLQPILERMVQNHKVEPASKFYLCYHIEKDTFVGVDFSVAEDMALFTSDEKLIIVGRLTLKALKKILSLSQFDYFQTRVTDIALSGVPNAIHFDLSKLAY